MYRALLNVPHPESMNSIRIMLESVGFECFRERDRNIEYVAESLLYLPYDTPLDDGRKYDMYVHIKPEALDGKENPLLFFINGGKREIPYFNYPTVTANFNIQNAFLSYVPWFNRLGLVPREKMTKFGKPIGLLNGGIGWGYKRFFPAVKDKIDIYGMKSPAGQLPQQYVKPVLSNAKCFVHLKTHDAPGYALYESFASAVPVVVPQFFVNNTKYHDLFIDGETCLIFGKGQERWHDDSLHESEESYWETIRSIDQCLDRLSDPEENYRIGINGLFKFKELTRWTPIKRDALEEYLKTNRLL